jgi:short-subunit dehydrogenase
MKDSSLRDNVMIITGASSGIGRALALQLAEQGAWLALAARDVDQLETAARDCRRYSGRAIVVRTDVAEQGQCQNLVEQTVAEYGRLDTLINNAGISMWTKFEDLKDLRVLERIMQVNYLGSAYLTAYALPYLKQTQGRIVAVSSLAGKNGVPTRSGYAASKHALVGFFDSLRIELAGTGVTVTIIYPGFVTSEIRERAFGADGKPLGKSPVRESEVMSAEECAHLMLNAIARRKREEVMTWRGKLGQWVKLLAPGMVDKIARQAIEEGK